MILNALLRISSSERITILMKLIGSSGRSANNMRTTTPKNAPSNRATQGRVASGDIPARRGARRRLTGMQKVLRTLIVLVCLLVFVGVSAFAIVRWQVQPLYDFFFRPTVSVLAVADTIDDDVIIVNPDNPDEVITLAEEREGERGSRLAPVEERNTDIFTFLIFGIEDDANTDVIMVASFNSIESTLEIVSIPRDTLSNVSWHIRRANSIVANARHRFRGEDNREELAMQATVEHFSDILGFNVDFWVTITENGFIRAINAIGPVDFYVPANMYEYGIRVNRGQQRLNGEQALTVMRTRRVYADADIGRIRTQQNFLHVLATSFINRRDQISIQDYADIFMNHTRTDIQINHLVWLGREMLQLDPENINFSIAPHSLAMINGSSYVLLDVDGWLEMVNTKLSPLNTEITADDVSILTRGANGRLFVTDGEWRGSAGWGGGPG